MNLTDIEKNRLECLLGSYSTSLFEQSEKRQSVSMYVNPCEQLIGFLKEKRVYEPRKITRSHLAEFQSYLYNEKDFSKASVGAFIRRIRKFFDYLIAKGEVKKNVVCKIKVLPEPSLPEAQQPHSYTYDELIIRYFKNQKRWVSYGYLNNVKKHLRGFIKYLECNDIKSVYVVTESTLLKYREYLWDDYVHYREDALVVRSQIERLRCVVRLFRFLRREGILNDNPAEKLGWEDYYKEIKEKAKTVPKKPEKKKDLTNRDQLMIRFLKYERSKGKDEKTISKYKKGLRVFFEYLDQRGISNLDQVTKRLVLDYFMYLHSYIGVRGELISNGYKNGILWSMKLFYKFLVRNEHLSKDPTLDCEHFKEEKGLPKDYLNEKEVFDLINRPKLNGNPLSYRDKAILEVLFSTAIRCNELSSLNLENINFQDETIRIDKPKGGQNKQRIVPVDKLTLETVKLYLKEGRPRVEKVDLKALFLSYSGRRLDNEGILNVVKKYAFECGFRKKITTHSLRVTCATLLLKNGANIRHVQDQLGHRSITSTQIYTRLAPVDLKEAHRKYHPRVGNMETEVSKQGQQMSHMEAMLEKVVSVVSDIQSRQHSQNQPPQVSNTDASEPPLPLHINPVKVDQTDSDQQEKKNVYN